MELEKPWALRGVVIGLALLVGVVTWFATRDGDDEVTPAIDRVEARIVSEAELAEIASVAGHPVYWAGPVASTELEATENPDGSVLVRYLEDGAGVGEGVAEFLAVGSYPQAGAVRALEGLAADPGATVRTHPTFGEVVSVPEAPNSAYFVDPSGSVQVEVYDGTPGRAMRLVLAGRIQPVG